MLGVKKEGPKKAFNSTRGTDETPTSAIKHCEQGSSM